MAESEKAKLTSDSVTNPPPPNVEDDSDPDFDDLDGKLYRYVLNDPDDFRCA